MWWIIAIISLFFTIGFLSGSINPNFLNKNLKEGQKPWTRTKAVIATGGFGFATLIFLGLASGSSQDAKPATSPTLVKQTQTASTPTDDKAKADQATKDKAAADAQAQAEAKKKAEEKAAAEAKAKADQEAQAKVQAQNETLGYGLDELQKRFNAAAAEFQTNFKINSLQETEGQYQNTYQYQFTNRLALLGTINKDNHLVKEVTILGQGDGTLKSGADLIASMGIVITSTNPDISKEDRGNILRELGLLDKNTDINNIDKSTVRNNVKYHIMSIPDVGITFIASNVNLK